jgi:hypothetical protein
MALRPQPGAVNAGSETDAQQKATSKGEVAFRSHLMIYLVTGCFLLTLNLLTSPGELWFYWPLFFWGWALIFQAVATFGTQAPARTLEALGDIIPGLRRAAGEASPSRSRGRDAAPFAVTAFAAVHERIESLREISRQIPEGPAHQQVARICATADRIAAALAADRASEELVTWFDTQLLTPTASLLSSYARLTTRGVASAGETLRRVEEQNLPLLESRFEALYAQLHRGEIVDLAVASEMLELEPPELPSTSQTAKESRPIRT